MSATQRQQAPYEWEFRTRVRVASKTGDKYIEELSKVRGGLRGDAFVAVQEVGLDSLCEIVNGATLGIDTLIRHVREMIRLHRDTTVGIAQRRIVRSFEKESHGLLRATLF